MRVLVLNGGSSSFKCWFRDLPDGTLPREAPQPQWNARADWSRHSGVAQIRVQREDGVKVERNIPAPAPAAVLEPVIESLWKGEAACVHTPSEIDVVGHRIVHGGPKYRSSTPLTADVRAAIAHEVEFAPAHNRFELEAVETVDRVVSKSVLQIAAFDTAFHATLEPPAYVYPGPYEWLQQGVRRYGFHGLSHQYASRRAAELIARGQESLKIVVCHLGNGASLAAVRDGKSVDTTMGFTPLEGLMMGTRCGSIDPGILIYLLRHRGYTAEQLDRILNQESGLLGVSGSSGDMRQIVQAADSGDERARLAYEVYTHRLTREIGGMVAVLSGLDALVFTGGVGENCVPLRDTVCARLGFLGLKLEANRNRNCKPDLDISVTESRVKVLVIGAQEEWEIARECHTLATRQLNLQRS